MGKVFSLFRRRKEAPLDVAEAQLRDLNAEVTKEEERRNKLVAARRRVMFALTLWGLPLILLGVGWAVAAVKYDWWASDGGFFHLLPALVVPFLLTFGSCYDMRIRRANRHIGVLQTQKAKVVDDLENSEEFKKFLEQKKKWDQLAQLKRDPVSTPVKAAPPAAARTPMKPATARPQQPPSTPLSASAPSVPPYSPAVTTPARASSVATLRTQPPEAAPPAAAAAPPASAPPPGTPAPSTALPVAAAGPAPTPAAAPPAATPKAYYRPVGRNNSLTIRPPPAAAKPPQGMLSWLTNVFIGDEDDDRYTAVPLMCQYCGAQNGLRENTHFKTAYYEFSCKSCNRMNQLRSAESLSDILAFAGEGNNSNGIPNATNNNGKQEVDDGHKPAASAPAATAEVAESPEQPKVPQAKKTD